MVDLVALHRLAMALPEVEAGADAVTFTIGGKALTWTYLARDKPRAKRLPIEGVVAIRCAIEVKEMLIEAAPGRFFDDDHYRGYPAVLARYALTDEAETAGLLAAAWRLSAPKAVARRHPEMGAD